jgi:ribosomal protein S18 acetylase RimI-like enzyme
MAEISFSALDVSAASREMANIRSRTAEWSDSQSHTHTEQVILRHSLRPGFLAFAALVGQSLIGYAYGAPFSDTWEWPRSLPPGVRAALCDRLAESFVVSELHVLPERQGNGVGRSLLRIICDSASADHVLLTTVYGETRARALYRSLGFADLTGPIAARNYFYTLMGATLPLPATPTSCKAPFTPLAETRDSGQAVSGYVSARSGA